MIAPEASLPQKRTSNAQIPVLCARRDDPDYRKVPQTPHHFRRAHVPGMTPTATRPACVAVADSRSTAKSYRYRMLKLRLQTLGRGEGPDRSRLR